ncbi:MAG TPA: CoB--CoM heterodisulfide reductase iron-sulfur subunit B family protein [Vicinamibacterales bacterium]|nr:CoB--CoM heterodisulfide reductase iron-sulfur subunit B family protein [Vicinamibacterales bacterium]
MSAYAYYPGCSLSGLGKPYDESVRAVFAHLGLGLEEIPDWNCCGATSYMSISGDKAVALAARNLALAEPMGLEIVAPCAACYLVLSKAQHTISGYPEIAARVHKGLQAAGLAYAGRAVIRHPLDVLVNAVGLDAIAAKVIRPLTGCRVAPYYGCQIVRPYSGFDDPLRPQTMDRLLEALGARVVEYPLKAHCCGGSLMGTMEDIGVRMSFLLLKEARARTANMVATACPLCQYNLEAYQGQMRRTYGEDVTIPIVYFTQLMGLAFGLAPKALGIQRNLVTADPLPVTV